MGEMRQKSCKSLNLVNQGSDRVIILGTIKGQNKIPQITDHNGFRGGRNILKLLNDKTADMSVPGFGEPKIRDICLLWHRRFPGMSASIPVKTERKLRTTSRNRSLP